MLISDKGLYTKYIKVFHSSATRRQMTQMKNEQNTRSDTNKHRLTRAIREMQINITRSCHQCTPEWLMWKWVDNPNLWQCVTQQHSHALLVCKMVQLSIRLHKFLNIKHTATLQLSNSTPSLSKGFENICPHKPCTFTIHLKSVHLLECKLKLKTLQFPFKWKQQQLTRWRLDVGSDQWRAILQHSLQNGIMRYGGGGRGHDVRTIP